jgi:hypothetical protein
LLQKAVQIDFARALTRDTQEEMLKFMCRARCGSTEEELEDAALNKDSDDEPAVLVCACATHISAVDKVISRAFTGRLGRAVLVKDVINVAIASKETRMLNTGKHVICDIVCRSCGTVIGWQYLETPLGQAYKRGCFILETTLMRKQNVGW